MNQVNVLITFPLEDELVEEVRRVDHHLRVSVLPQEERALYRGSGPGWLVDPLVSLPEGVEVDEVRRRLDDFLAEAEVIYTPARLPTDLLDRAPRLRWLQSTAAGADRLIAMGLVGKGVIVTSASGAHATPVGEYVMAVMLMFAKGAPRFVRNQQQARWDSYWPGELYGKTVGIVGLGSIGREVARLAKAFGMQTLGIRRFTATTDGGPSLDVLLPPDGLHQLLAQSDYVVLAVPLTPETTGLIGEAELRTMKPTAYLINVSRGLVVDEGALIRALEERRIAGAGLDVFQREPLPSDSPLWRMENVIVTPHIAGGSGIYNYRVTQIFCENLRRYLAGEPLLNVVDPQRGY